MANSSAIRQQAAHTTTPTNYHLLAAQQEPYNKSLTKQKKRNFWKKVRRMDY